MRWRAVALMVLVAMLPARVARAAATPGSPDHVASRGVTIQTYPPVSGARFQLGTRTLVADGGGRLVIPAEGWSSLRLRLHYVPDLSGRTVRLRFNRWSGAFRGAHLDRLNAYLATWYLVRPTYEDGDGAWIDPRLVTSATLRSSIGEQVSLHGDRPVWLKGRRVALGPFGPRTKVIGYRVDSVRAAGAQVVFRARQTFVPAGGLHLVIKVRFYHVVFVARDALFGFPTGRSIELTHPDGRVQRLALGSDGVASLGPLVRGQYRVKVEGAAMGGPQPLALSRDQDVSLTVVTLLDLATASAALLVLAVSILLLGRPHLRRGIRTKVRRGLPGPRRTVEQVRR